MNRLAPLTLAILSAVIAAGCMYPRAASPPASLTPAELEAVKASFPEATDASLTAGRDLFVARCADCHDHPDVMSIPDDEWPGVMKSMGAKAELDADQAASVKRFILAVTAARRKAPASR